MIGRSKSRMARGPHPSDIAGLLTETEAETAKTAVADLASVTAHGLTLLTAPSRLVIPGSEIHDRTARAPGRNTSRLRAPTLTAPLWNRTQHAGQRPHSVPDTVVTACRQRGPPGSPREQRCPGHPCRTCGTDPHWSHTNHHSQAMGVPHQGVGQRPTKGLGCLLVGLLVRSWWVRWSPLGGGWWRIQGAQGSSAAPGTPWRVGDRRLRWSPDSNGRWRARRAGNRDGWGARPGRRGGVTTGDGSSTRPQARFERAPYDGGTPSKAIALIEDAATN